VVVIEPHLWCVSDPTPDDPKNQGPDPNMKKYMFLPLLFGLSSAYAGGTAAPIVGESPWDLDGDVRIEHATVWTAAGDPIADGTVVIREGRITYVGPSQQAPARESELVVDATGRHVTPGIIDTHSHLGVYPSPSADAHQDGNEMVAPSTPDAEAWHAFWPQDPGLQRAVAGGITALHILPGSANLIGGRGVTMRPLPAPGSGGMRMEQAPGTVKMACGENPKRVYGERGGPRTRMGNVARMRAAFLEAQSYRERWDGYHEEQAAFDSCTRKCGSAPEAPSVDLRLETLSGILRGDLLPQVHCYRSDDMLHILEIAEEAGFQVRGFHHAVEAYKIRDVLAERGVGINTWADWWGFKLEAYDAIEPNAALNAEAGVHVVIHSDSAVGIQRLNQEAAKALWAGRDLGVELSDTDALRWITAEAAWMLGIDDHVGTLEVGKMGDVVIWDQAPLSMYSSAQTVFIQGTPIYDREADVNWSDFLEGREVAP